MDKFIFLCSVCILMNMDINLTYSLTKIEEGRIRVTISVNDQVEMGTLYFEKAKRTFQRKPIGMDSWACVDAKIEGLYQVGESITPKEIVAHCQNLIKDGGY